MDISSMLEVQVKEMKVEIDVKENVTPRDQAPSTTTTTSIPISQEEKNFYELMFSNDIASIRYRRLHCTACDVHIGSAPSQAPNMLEHPVLRTLLCAKCREFYGDGTFEQGDDATDMFCRWCANGGNLYCCSYCSNTFCYKCIRRNFSSLVRKKIEADEKWKCFVCNPYDLYSARATCWALLHHIQTVTRILKNEKNMSSEEIEEKMNLDETQCCPRRNKRRSKRRVESNSEEEDETYTPKTNGLPVHIKRKQMRRIKPIVQPKNNGTFTGNWQLHSYAAPILIKPHPTSLMCVQSFKQAESQSRFSHEPVMIKREETTVKQSSEGSVAPQSSVINSDEVSLPRYEPSVLQPTLYHTTIMNHAAASNTYIRPRAMNPTTHQLILPPPPSSQTQNSYQSAQSLQPPPNAMVSMPTSCVPQFLVPRSRSSNMILTPNIIELDSDSDDEPRVVGQHHNLLINEGNDANVVDTSYDKVIPVALVSTENGENDVREQPIREICTTLERRSISFSETMLPHNQELDKLLDNTKQRLCSFFALPDNNNTSKDVELMAHQKITQFYKNMRDTVFQLAHINDRVVREYNKWKRSRKTGTASLSAEQKTLMSQENIEIPLDMTCMNDSDTEPDYEESECQIMESSNLVKDSNIIKDLFFRKDMVHRGVGDSSLLSEDKAIQVSDTVLMDYEKYISYSPLTKVDYDPTTNDSVLESMTTSMPDENFGKYEEQYIFYLQQIEDHNVETEDMKELIDPNETSLKEPIETNLPSVSELLQDINSSVVSTDQSKNCNQEKNSENCVNLEINNEADVSASVVHTNDNKNTRIVDTISDNGMEDTDTQSDGKTQKPGSQKNHNGVIDGEVTSINNDDVSSNKNTDAVDTEAIVTGNEEDCTIIDD